MRSIHSPLDLGLVLLALLALLHTQGTNAQPEKCAVENCMESYKCETKARSLECDDPTKTCCSLVKEEHRNLCRHWGGECMDRCPARLEKTPSECVAPQKCCILVH